MGTLIALELEKFREPKLEIAAREEASDDITYQPGRAHAGERWKFFRVRVTNREVPKWLHWLLERETAQQVIARVTLVELGRTMKGRWSGTLELPQASPLDYARLANFPDPVTIAAGSSESLDVFVKPANDQNAYRWNNEAYLFNWRTPTYRLAPGDYRIEVEVTALNGPNARRSFKAHIEAGVDATSLTE